MKYRRSTDAAWGWVGAIGFILLWLLSVTLSLGLMGTIIWALYHIVTKYVINA